MSLNTALDDALTWSTAATAGDVGGWFGQTAVQRAGDTTGSAKSARIADGQSSSIQTSVIGPGNLRFYWSVSSETNYDFLSVYVDGVRQTGRISGSVGFTQQTWAIPSGSHILKWAYSKVGTVSSGADVGYLDTVSFTQSPTPATYVLSLTKNNSPYNPVTSSPAGVSCGTSCSSASASFGVNTSVKLTAQPIRGRRFSSWSGACSGSSTTCTALMSASKSVTANFR